VLEKKVDETPNDHGRAEPRIIHLGQPLAEQKADIAPVGVATFDVLSFIFEICAETDWRSALWIGCVSRHWRSVVLQTPRAWRLFDFSICNSDCRDAYFERSGQCGLHIALTIPNDTAQLVPMAHRMHFV